MRFSFANSSMKEQIAQLWRLCFKDSERYISFYLDNIFRPNEVFVALPGENIAAMLTILPVEATAADGGKLAGRYIFAVATHPDYQGRGISTALLGRTHETLRAAGCDFSVLVPASESLFEFYKKRGFKTLFYQRRMAISGDSIPQKSGTELKAAQLESLMQVRGRAFSPSTLYCGWPSDVLRRLEAECRVHGGETVEFVHDGGMGYAVCYPAGDTLHVKECVPHTAAQAVLPALHERYKKSSYIIRLPAGAGEGEPFAMVHWYRPIELSQGEPPYISLVMD